MKLVDKLLQANESALEWSEVQRDNRLRSISQNAVQQARIPFGRGYDPFTDADAQALNDVYMILTRLERKGEIIPEQQHHSMSPVSKPDSDNVLDRVARALTHPSDEQFPPDDAA